MTAKGCDRRAAGAAGRYRGIERVQSDAQGPDDASPPAGHEPRGNALGPGTRLAEFEIERVIGEGGFGIVYLAFDHQLHRKVAIKEYLPGAYAYRRGDATITAHSGKNKDTFDAGLKSFLQEARLLAQFEHPALLKVLRFWEANGTGYMAMPHYQGRTLREILKTEPGYANERNLKRLIRPLLEAVEQMHAANCYHRDISPDNIIVQPSGNPVLLDFGAARRIIGNMTKALTVVLKDGFAPIEQYADDGGIAQGPWTDVYGLAALLYTAVTGSPPQAAVARVYKDALKPLADLAPPGYGERFLAGIDAGLAVRPEMRPQTIAAFRDALGISPRVDPDTSVNLKPGDDQRTIALPPSDVAPRARTAPPVPDESRTQAAVAALSRQAAHARADDAPPRVVVTHSPERRGAGRGSKSMFAVGAVAVAAAAAGVAYYWRTTQSSMDASKPQPSVVATAPSTAPTTAPQPASATPLPAPPSVSADPPRESAVAQPAPAPAATPSPAPPVAMPSEPPPPPPAPTVPPPASPPPARETPASKVDEKAAKQVEAEKTAKAKADADRAARQAEAEKMERAAKAKADADRAARQAEAEKSAKAKADADRAARQAEAESAAKAKAAEKAKTPEPKRPEPAVVATVPPSSTAPVPASPAPAPSQAEADDKDLSDEARRLRASAERDPAAAVALGKLYASGKGAPRSDTEAARWFRRAADAGSAEGAHFTGALYASGRGVPKDGAEAARWYRKAADSGFALSQNNLGAMYAEGQGVAKDEAEAARWYRKAAEQGHAGAQLNLGVAYELGRGVPRDDAEAFAWYRKAAEQGNARAQNNVAVMYAKGQGVAKDEAEAARWYRRAAEQGVASAQFNLAAVYADGRGVMKDEAEAVQWYRKAASQGYAPAVERLKVLGR